MWPPNYWRRYKLPGLRRVVWVEKTFTRGLFRWFNPQPETTGGDVEQQLKLTPYPGDQDTPFGFDFAEALVLGDALFRSGSGHLVV